MFRPISKSVAFSSFNSNRTTNGISTPLNLNLTDVPSIVISGVIAQGVSMQPVSYPTGSTVIAFEDGYYLFAYTKIASGTNSGNLQINGANYYDTIHQNIAAFHLI